MIGSESRVAFAQDWLTAEAGAERVAVEMTRLLPSADVYTTFSEPGLFGGIFDKRGVRTWPFQRVSALRRHFRSMLPLYPFYFSGLDLRNYELVVSGSIAFTHAVRTSKRATHISYVYTPMRYAWDQDAYFEASSWGRLAKTGGRVLRAPLQRWDRATANRPDVLVAISGTVRDRIAKVWGRDSEVIYPGVDVDELAPSTWDDGFLLVAARMLGYRRLDHAVEAATRLRRELVIVGDGPERARLERLAGPTVRFRERVDRVELIDLYQRCHAYLVPGIEDFGIAPVEAMAAGKPVVAFGRGGVAETVIDGRTGVLYEEQSVDGLASAIERLDGLAFHPSTIRARAEEFATPRFHAQWRALLARLGVDPSLYSAG